MSISKQKARSVKHAVLAGDEQLSVILDGSTNTTQDIEFTGPVQKISMQSSGSLAFTYDVSINGINFTGSPVSVAANVMASYSTHNLGILRLTWVSGSGRVTVLGA